ncbi:MAG TPA: L,D-transpeptidase [Longimicrobiales bacterium]
MHTMHGRSTAAAILLALIVGVGSERADDARPEAVGMRIVINTAARKLYVYEYGERTRTYTVAVGRRGHRTPTGTYSISKVVWNPWWRPPARRWAAGRKDTPPGPHNPMGRVKMYFRNLYYIHGTPEEGSLGRAVSHGCVRMANSDAIALARLVHKYGGGATSATIDRLVRNSRATRTIWLKRRIPVEIVSRSAAVEDGRLELYGMGGSAGSEEVWRDALAALREAGFDMATLDRERLWAMVEASRRSPVSVRLGALEAGERAEGRVRVS